MPAMNKMAQRKAMTQKAAANRSGTFRDPEHGGPSMPLASDVKRDFTGTTSMGAPFTAQQDVIGDITTVTPGQLEGYNVVEDEDGNIIFKAAPGNKTSMFNEIISGEVASIIQENPDLTDEEIAAILEERYGDLKGFKDGKSKLEISIAAGRNKHKQMNDGVDLLNEQIDVEKNNPQPARPKRKGSRTKPEATSSRTTDPG